MVRLFIFVLFRFFIITLAVYFALWLLKKIIQTLQGQSRPAPRNPQQENQQHPKEEYRDVKDAKFVELPNTKAEEKND